MCRYIASASARGRELSGRVRADAYNFSVLYSGPAASGALRIKARDIVMAGLNARGLQSKLLITPLSSEAIIMKSTEVQTLGTILTEMLHVLSEQTGMKLSCIKPTSKVRGLSIEPCSSTVCID